MWDWKLLTVFAVSVAAGMVLIAALVSSDGNLEIKGSRGRRAGVILAWAVTLAMIGTLGSLAWTWDGAYCTQQFCATWPAVTQYYVAATFGVVFTVVILACIILLAVVFIEWAASFAELSARERAKTIGSYAITLTAWPYWLLRAAWRTLSAP